MPITIHRHRDKYDVSATPDYGHGVSWTSPEPLSREELIRRLQELGWHQIDIGDALHQADREWLERLYNSN